MDDRGSKLNPAASAGDVYTKLAPGEIRILLLGPGKKGSPIECEMKVVPSPTASQYEALSYVWGDTNQSRSIRCNDFEFQVTESLYTALDHLRYDADCWRRLWVDQLSINQMRKDELMSQVGQMDSIYSSAARVIVWLGPCNNKMASAWELLEETALSSSLARSDFLGSSSGRSLPKLATPRRVPSRSCISKYSKRASSSRESLASSTSSLNSINTPTRPKNKRQNSPPSLKYALSIFQHPWFGRKWTFQEIVLANAAVICCGSLEMAWADLTSWYFHYASKLRSSSLLYDSDGSFGNIMNIRSEVNKGQLKLSNLLMLTRPRLSTKAEDAIYAILGLLPELTAHLKSTSTRVGSPDKPLSRERALFELYLSAFRYCLETENDLAVLSAAGIYKGNSRADGWPSWLPDWRQQLPLRPLVLTEPTVLGPEPAFDDETFGCSPASPMSDIVEDPVYKLNLIPPSDSVSGCTMIVQGLRLGCVATRPGSWPSNFLVADPIAQEKLTPRKSISGTQFSQSVASLTSNSPKLVQILHRSKSQGSSENLSQTSIDSETQCESIRTSASVEAGDWLCAFRGGRLLYALRPLYEDDTSGYNSNIQGETRFAADQSDHTGSQGMDQTRYLSQTPLKYRFVGECAVHGLYPSDIFEASNANGESLSQFELV